MTRLLGIIVAFAMFAECVLIFGGYRVIMGETYLPAGTDLSQYGMNAAAQDALLCRYFDGLRMRESIFLYAPNGVGGYDACPTLTKVNSHAVHATDRGSIPGVS